MQEFLDKLRAKPLHVRQRLSWLFMAALSFLIVSIWWNTGAVTSQEDTMRSPLSVVGNMAGSIKANAVRSWNNAIGELEYKVGEMVSDETAGAGSAAGMTYPEEVFSQERLDSIATATDEMMATH